MSTIKTDKIIPVGSALTMEGAAVFTAGISANSTMILGGAATLSSTLNVSGATTLTTATTGLVTCSTAPSLAGHLCNKTYVDGTSSKNTSGYTKLPNGILIQWGETAIAGVHGGLYTISYPIAFTAFWTNTFALQQITYATTLAGNPQYLYGKTTATPTSNFIVQSGTVGSGTQAATVRWFAIGLG